MAFPIVRLACLALVLQYSTSTAHADAPPGLGGQEVVEVKYRVQEERGVVPEKVREIILSTMDPAERKRGGIVWPEGSIVTDHKLVAAPFGMRFERKIVSVNDMPVAKVSRPAMYPLEEMYVALQDGRCEQANNGPAPTGGGVQGRDR